MLNPNPLIEALETTAVAVPGFLIASVCVFLFPTGTVPNDTEDGVADKRDVVDPEPVPLNATVTKTAPLLFLSVSVPVEVPDAVGLKPTAKYVVPPILKENGIARELMLNPDPLMELLPTVTPSVLVFLIASVCVTLFPTGTVPNDTDDGAEVSAAACAFPGVSSSPANASKGKKYEEKCRREGPPGSGLVKKACWKTLQKESCRLKNRVLDKFIPDPAYGPRYSRIY